MNRHDSHFHQDANNWIGPRWLSLYRNANDPRLLVPKAHRWMGWTLNLAHPVARFLVAGSAFAVLLGLGLMIARSL